MRSHILILPRSCTILVRNAIAGVGDVQPNSKPAEGSFKFARGNPGGKRNLSTFCGHEKKEDYLGETSW